MKLTGRHFLKLLDFAPAEIEFLLDLSAELKQARRAGREVRRLEGRQIALIFEKTSTRTRCAFEAAAYDQGAHVTYLDPTGSQLGKKESIRDTARVLGRMYHGIEYRGFEQAKVEELARYAGVPVWNGLTNEFHPTQALADLLTMREHSPKPLSQVAFAFLGDGRNNVANSLLVAAAKMGMDFRIVAPATLQPAAELLSAAYGIARETGARISVTDEIARGVKGCDFLYTDVWVSMGEPDAVWEERIRLLQPYQVDSAAMAQTGNPQVKFLHCLPAFHDRQTETGEAIFRRFGLEAMEVTDAVFESPASVVFDQAENRLHTIKAILVATLSNE
ncbi:MAG: ornithine carbamoyltransferase [Desulfobacteraceae bacterium]|nr:MAG: ornithine carbamoyltransferase [Desulfobacteraceae bacterium]